MRIRYLKNTPAILEASPLMEAEPERYRGEWRSYMENRAGRAPEHLYLEIGCGRGGFLRDMARLHPADAFLGLEKFSTILARTVQNMDPERDTNLVLLRAEADTLREIVAPGEVDGIYLNFSDPWPKERHAKRRLTSDRFLPIYAELLKPGGILRFKTDNDALFAYSVESMTAGGWTILARTDDLHAEGEPLGEGNVRTEYEANFMALGKKIHCLEAVFTGSGTENLGQKADSQSQQNI
jgi:tRNA (guanine-N7-)-methyltransferase